MRAGVFLSSVSALLLLPGLTAASTISYLTQDRSVVAVVPDDAPGVAIAADFGVFDEDVDAMGLESGDDETLKKINKGMIAIQSI